jgi:DNA processing protein
VKGRASIASAPIVAIVGARNGSAAGAKVARLLAEGLGQAGIVIASGFARGIDTAAHRAALRSGTIAVLAGGIDNIYPPENDGLYAELAEHGMIVSERPPGFVPRGPDFPRRNRLISGMSAAVIVVEAAARSGSLHTARRAAEQGRDVFAVPGSPLDPRSEGTNALIRQGATLITCADDVLQDLAPAIGRLSQARADALEEPDGPKPPPEIGSGARDAVLDALSYAPVDIDELIRMSGLSAREVSIVLLELDLAGRLERHGAQTVSLAG